MKIPALAAGNYLLDAIARDAKGNSLGWTTFILSAHAQGDLSVSLDKDVYEPGQPVTITAQVENAPEGNYTATLRVVDSLDRLLQHETQPVVGTKVRWTFTNRDPLCVLHYADVQVKRNGAPYLASRTDTFVFRFTFPDFHSCLWGHGCLRTQPNAWTGGCAKA